MIDYDRQLFNIDIPGRRPSSGSLLVAEPFLREDHFVHSVICLVDYEERGTAMGVVLNRSTGYTLQSVIEGVTRRDAVEVWCGGPMSCDRLYFLHTVGHLIPDGREVAPGLYLGGDFEAMLDYVNSGCPIDGAIRFFIGYSGWSPGQLDEEIGNHVWAVCDSGPYENLLKGGDDAMWHENVRRLGHNYRGWLYHPRNPLLN